MIGGLGEQLGGVFPQLDQQLRNRQNDLFLQEYIRQQARLQALQRHAPFRQQPIREVVSINTWPVLIEFEIRKHLPSTDYEVFVQRAENRDAYLARIHIGSEIVAEIFVPAVELRHGIYGWKTRMLNGLSADIERRKG